MKEAVGDTTALYGLLCGPFTLASHLRGNDIFMDMFDDEDYVKDLLGFCADCAKRMSDLYLDAGMDVIAVVDPLVSQISSDHFEEFLSAPYTELFRYLREEKQAFSSFFVCGNATRNIEVMCRTAPDSISMDENVDILAAKAICDKYNVAIGGNIPLTSIMLHGTQQDNMKFVADLLAQLPEYKNFIVAPGCDMPYAVPVENTIGAAQAVLETEAVREMVKNYVAAEDDIAVELPDYENLPRPLIEVFTLDSATCAACTYMMGAANVAKDTFGDAIDMVEYKFTLKENIARCKKMGVKNLPSIYINGKLKFSSIIPSKEELEAANVQLEQKPIGVDALVFIVNEDNPVTDLTQQQLRDIYAGKITNWKDVGGQDLDIVAFQRRSDSGSQTLFQKLLIQGGELMNPPTELAPTAMGELVDSLAAYNNSANAIGFSVYYYIDQMYSQPGLRLLSVDGVMPSNDTLADGSYPLCNDFCAVIRPDAAADSPERQLYDWLDTEAGQACIKKAGYVPAGSATANG